MKADKKAISALIATVLLIALVLAAFLTVSQFYRFIVGEKQKEASRQMAQLKCPENFNFLASACFNETAEEDAELHLSILNTKEMVSSGSLVALKGEGTSMLIPLPPFSDVESAESLVTVLLYPKTLKLQKIQLMPVLVLSELNARVICENFPDVEVKPC